MKDVEQSVSTCATLLNEDITDNECGVLTAAFQLQKLSTRMQFLIL